MKILIVLVAAVFVLGRPALALQEMPDSELAQTSGQALFFGGYTGPGGANPNMDVGFYKLGIEARLALNANIRKLQLGCGGFKGPGCDIDIDNVSFSGLAGDGQDAGVPTDFIMNNPFFEFAIKNPGNSATRQIVGIRLGTGSAYGLVSAGTNSDPNNINDDTGINTFSGDMGITVQNGRLTNVHACGAQLLGVCTLDILAEAQVDTYTTHVAVNRASAVSLGPLAGAAQIQIPLLNLISLRLNNIHINNQPLRALHRAEVRNADGTPTQDFYLSMQKQDIFWQRGSGAWFDQAAKAGWWLSIPQVVLPNVVITDRVEVGTFVLLGGLIFNSRVDVSAKDFGQQPVDNCWGASRFC